VPFHAELTGLADVAPGLPPPNGVPQFPLAGLNALMLVALLLPALLLKNRMRSRRSLA
jgi:hypothetical protein